MQIKARFFILFLVLFPFTISVAPASAMIRIMPLGDSITVGATGSSTNSGYRRELYFLLTGAGYSVNFVGSQLDGTVPDFDRDHEGHSGWHADGNPSGNNILPNVRTWLLDNPADIVLLHIGTNDIPGGEDADEIDGILDEIDQFSTDTWVILARIINRNIYSQETTDFNDSVEAMVQDRINLLDDKVVIVDMENGAGINYDLVTDNPPGDMWDDLHPFETGYDKMAAVWFSGIQQATLPVADAGPDQSVLVGNTVTLDASNSTDPDGNIVSYLWQQTGGIPVVLSDDQVEQPTFTAPNVGPAGDTLTFTLTVTDNDGFISTDNTSVIVKIPIPPVADAGPDQDVDEGDSVTLDGSNSTDPDGNIVSYLWQQTGGIPVVLSGAQTAVATFTAPDVGSAGDTLTFTLTVTDNDAIESTDTASVIVHNPTSSSSSGGGGGGGGGCFIATAAYGSPQEPHVKVLRDLRDHFLLTNFIVKTFMNLYYTYTPPMANFTAEHDSLRELVRWRLMPLTGMSWLFLHINVQATRICLALLVVLGSLSVTHTLLRRWNK